MTFTARELNHRITFEASVETRDEDGAVVTAWEQVGAASFAKMEPLVGREYFSAAALQSEGLVKFTIRYRADITTAMRLIHGGQPWNMTSIQNIKGRNREALIYAKRLE